MPNTKPRKPAKEVPAHPKRRGQERIQQSHDLKKTTGKTPVMQKRFTTRAMGNR